MTLQEKFENVEIMFESQIGILKYDELCESSNQCEKIADEFAINFFNWCISEEAKDLMLDLIIVGEVTRNITTKELLEIYKKEKGL